MISRIHEAAKKHSHRLSMVIFVAGFLIDSFALPGAGDPITKYLGLIYLLVVAFAVLLREFIVSRNTATTFEQRLYSVITFGIAFFSGSLLSFVFIHYFRSADLYVSWPLFVGLLLVMVFNEFISSHNFRFLLDITVLIIGHVFFVIFNIPILIKAQNDTVFVVSVVISGMLAIVYVSLLKRMSETAEAFASKAYALSVVIPLAVLFLYFTNIIPPVPLALREAGIYHNVNRLNGDEYIGQAEEPLRFQFMRGRVFHFVPGTRVYFFSSVFAPNELQAPLSHAWEYYDETSHTWLPKFTIEFPLTGGRDEGYRAYSFKENMTAGKWRVSVKVGNNRVIGRMTFTAQEVESLPTLIEEKL